VFRWLGIYIVLPQHVGHLYNQIGHSIRGAKIKRLKKVFWHATCWSLWNARNNVIFNNAEPKPGGILISF